MTIAAASSTCPRITTERLLLREYQAKDFEPYAEYMADPAERKHISVGTLDRRTAWSFFLAGAGGWFVAGGGWWTVELVESSHVVGIVGAFIRETNVHRGRDADVELGWTIYKPFRKRGFAREAAAAALAFAIQRHDPKRVVAHVAPENVASAAVGKAIGMKFVGDTDFYGEPTHLYAFERH